MAKGDELKKKRAEKYEKSELKIHGTFDEVKGIVFGQTARKEKGQEVDI